MADSKYPPENQRQFKNERKHRLAWTGFILMFFGLQALLWINAINLAKRYSISTQSTIDSNRRPDNRTTESSPQQSQFNLKSDARDLETN